MYYKRSWTTFGICVLVLGVSLIGLGIWGLSGGISEDEIMPLVIMMLVGIVIAAAGVWVLVWHLKDKLKHTGGKVDKNQEYKFILTTDQGTEVVTDYSQIENALNQLGQTRQGMVEVKIEPPIANICSIDCCYKAGYFQTYVQQIREDGIGYWYMLSESIQPTEYDFKQLYKHKKKVYYKLYNRKETGEGR